MQDQELEQHFCNISDEFTKIGEQFTKIDQEFANVREDINILKENVGSINGRLDKQEGVLKLILEIVRGSDIERKEIKSTLWEYDRRILKLERA